MEFLSPYDVYVVTFFGRDDVCASPFYVLWIQSNRPLTENLSRPVYSIFGRLDLSCENSIPLSIHIYKFIYFRCEHRDDAGFFWTLARHNPLRIVSGPERGENTNQYNNIILGRYTNTRPRLQVI